MKRITWITDTHFDKFDGVQFERALWELKLSQPDYVFHTGDISEAPSLIEHLERLQSAVNCPVYFVLGNHDLYYGSTAAVHNNVREMCSTNKNLVWLTDVPSVQLNDSNVIVGHDGWYDASKGWTSKHSIVYRPDWHLIHDFSKLRDGTRRLNRTKEVAFNSAITTTDKIRHAFEKGSRVHFLTHVPPWAEPFKLIDVVTSWFWSPYNVSTIMGQTLEKLMAQHPERELIVYCGHVHVKETITAKIKHNVSMKIGAPFVEGLKFAQMGL